MIEAAEHVQNLVLPVPEVPAPRPPELPPQVPADPSQPNTASQDESSLTAQISELWRLHTDYAATMRSQSQNLRSLRTELGKKLSEMKLVLARPGRSGQWSGWLKERKIPRATADRLVAKYERALNPDGNRLTEAISEPTEEEIKTLFGKVAGKLRRGLRTPASAYRLLDLLSASLAVNREDREEGFIIFKPSAHGALEQSVPAEAQVNSVPIITDILANGDVQSTSTSLAL